MYIFLDHTIWEMLVPVLMICVVSLYAARLLDVASPVTETLHYARPQIHSN